VSGDPGADIFEGISADIFDPENMGDSGLLGDPTKIPDSFGKFDFGCTSFGKRKSKQSEKNRQ
jgi:hypothetical protein